MYVSVCACVDEGCVVETNGRCERNIKVKEWTKKGIFTHKGTSRRGEQWWKFFGL